MARVAWTITRSVVYLTLMIFSITVFACISDQLFVSGGCLLYDNRSSCNYAVATGVISFVFTLFLLAAALMDFGGRKPESLGPLRFSGIELIINAVLAVLWFIAGIVLAAKQSGLGDCSGHACNCGRAALGLSWINWALATAMVVAGAFVGGAESE